MAKVMTGVTIAAAGTAQSASVALSGAAFATILIDGDTNTLLPDAQFSMDGTPGGTWFTLQAGGMNASAIGSTGGKPWAGVAGDSAWVVACGGASYMRISINNSGAGTATVSAWIQVGQSL